MFYCIFSQQFQYSIHYCVGARSDASKNFGAIPSTETREAIYVERNIEARARVCVCGGEG
jgi:hypothetical protein